MQIASDEFHTASYFLVLLLPKVFQLIAYVAF
jgi:hypothetical protein